MRKNPDARIQRHTYAPIAGTHGDVPCHRNAGHNDGHDGGDDIRCIGEPARNGLDTLPPGLERASSGDYRRRDHNRRRSDDHRRVRVMIPQRNAEAHTSARVGRSRQRGDCNCTNKE
jgi:hypothetical protein